jgi:hypothetical protein
VIFPKPLGTTLRDKENKTNKQKHPHKKSKEEKNVKIDEHRNFRKTREYGEVTMD